MVSTITCSKMKYIPQNETEEAIRSVCVEVTELLISKNRKYGNSALNPKRIFAKSDDVEQLCTRIDDKLSRIANLGWDGDSEDAIKDLIGYLVLLKIKLKQRDGNDIRESVQDGQAAQDNTGCCAEAHIKWTTGAEGSGD